MVPCREERLEAMSSAGPLAASAPSPGGMRASSAGDRPRLLVIDDQANLRCCVARLLQNAGYKVEEAASGDEGMRRLQQTTAPDVVLTDLQMPGLSGWDIVRAAHVLHPGLPVLVMTARPDPLEAACGAETLVAAILPKPFGIEELLDRLAALPGTASGAPGSSRPADDR